VNYETITVDVQDYIVTITFNRPEHLNAFNIQMIREFDYLWRTIRSDDLVRVIVITGKGRAFLYRTRCARDGVDASRGAQPTG